MTLIEALKTGRPLNRKRKTWTYRLDIFSTRNSTILPGGYIDPDYLFSLGILKQIDVLADDWIVQGLFESNDYETVG